jgi:Thioesterase-like superfamily
VDAVFVRDGANFAATPLGRGPWDPRALHGGAPAALLAREFERCASDPELTPARITYELVRPVPLGPLSVAAEVVRPGRRVTLLDGSIRDGAGTEVMRARALLLRPSAFGSGEAEPPPFPGPDHGAMTEFASDGSPMFATHAMEIRFVEGAFMELGAATAWFRLREPLVDGESPSPLQSLAAAGDFGNGISAVLPWSEHVFINPDLTLYIEREPVGEWICLRAQTRVREHGIGFAEAVVYDVEGRVGRSLQALLITPVPT